MTRGPALILVVAAALVTFSAAWIAWFGIEVCESDLYAFAMFVTGLVVGIAGAWVWRNW